MIERLEDRGLEEPLELEGTHDGFSKCRNSKVKYTRDLLLELTEVEVCRKLPSDFDLLILSQLDEGYAATVEHKGIFGKPSDHGPLLTTNWNLAFPGERWSNHLHSQSKDSHSQQNCSLERRDVCQPLQQKSENDAGVLHCEIPKTDSFQLTKTRNPYRPPHISKKMPQSLATFYEHGVESSWESDQKGSADGITGHGKSGFVSVAKYSTNESLGGNEAFMRNNKGNEATEPSEPLGECRDLWVELSGESDQKYSADDITGHAKSGYSLALEVANDSTKESFDRIEAFRKSNKGNEATEPSEPLDEYEEFWRTNEGNEVIGASRIREGLIEDNQPTFDDFWGEILEIIHLQQEPNISRMSRIIHADSEVEIHFPDEESLASIEPLPVPQNSNYLELDGSNDVANSEAEIILPDEDSLISIHDMIAFDISMPTINSGSLEADTGTSNIAVDSRKSSKYANFTKPNDWTKRLHRRAQPSLNFSRFATRGQLYSPLPHSLTSMDIIGPGFLPFLMTPNHIPYTRYLNCFTQSDIHHPFCLETTLPNTNTQDSVSHYSLSHQPNIFLQQPSHPLFDTCADSTLSVYDTAGMHFMHSTSQKAIHEGFGNSKAETPCCIKVQLPFSPTISHYLRSFCGYCSTFCYNAFILTDIKLMQRCKQLFL